MIKPVYFKAFFVPNTKIQHPEKHPGNKKVEQCTDKNKDNGCQPLKPLDCDKFVKSIEKREDKKETNPQEVLKDVLKNDLTNK